MRSASAPARILVAAVIGAALAACSAAQQQRIQAGFDQNILDYTVGRDYATIAAREAMTQQALFGDDRAYGDFFGASQLSGGDTLYRHLERSEAATSSSDVLGLVGGDSARIDYRLFYFRVGPDGVIKDYANGVVSGELVRCSYYLGGVFQNCGNTEIASADIAQMDAAVTTSSGQPLASWQ